MKIRLSSNILYFNVYILTGYDRSIVGFPRYTVIGNKDIGEHNLHISDTTLDDDAEFQCQVTPAGGDPALTGSAYLQVLSEYNEITQTVPKSMVKVVFTHSSPQD